MTTPADRWQRALLAAVVVAVDPGGLGGIALRAKPGPVRNAWLKVLLHLLPGETPVRKMPASIDEGALLGGLDLAATLAAGRPVATKGVLACADKGVVIAAMAERIAPHVAAHVAATLDTHRVRSERDGLGIVETARFGLIALDEGEEDEHMPAALRDRLAILLDLDGIGVRDIAGDKTVPDGDLGHVRDAAASVDVPDDIVDALCKATDALGIDSARPAVFALRAARILAALEDRATATADDARDAAALVLAPRATRVPAQESQASPEDTPQDDPPDAQEDDAPQDDTLDSDRLRPEDIKPVDDLVLEAATAALPAGLLARIAAGGVMRRGDAGARGKAGQSRAGAQQGRIVGARAGFSRGRSRLDIIATLRAAAPWQKLRKTADDSRIAIRRDDFRIARYKEKARTTTIFLVDASGSAALQRLAEAKGAVRLLLADCYIRRDEVALLAFRGRGADLLLPPTRSLVRAERALASLPGGGGTPLAAGLDAAVALAETERRKGRTPTLVLMTDGRANVARDGTGGRAKAQDDAQTAARAWRTCGCAAIVIDTSATPHPLAADIAASMNARYLPLPHADARATSLAVKSVQARAIRGGPA